MSRALDRLVAETLGWKAIHYEDEGHMDACIVNGKGEKIGGLAFDGALEDAWSNAFTSGVVPRWKTDANAALALWDTIPDDYTPRLVRMVTPKDGKLGYVYRAVIMPNVGDGEEFEARADTPAEALCYAWLAYRGVEIPADV